VTNGHVANLMVY